MPDDSAEEYETITIALPASMLRPLREEAGRQFRTLDGQIAWQIRESLQSRGTGDGYGPELLEAVKSLHLERGQPSIRDIAQKANRAIGPSTIAGVLAGSKAVRWHLLETLVKALDGDVDHFRKLWIQDKRDYQ